MVLRVFIFSVLVAVLAGAASFYHYQKLLNQALSIPNTGLVVEIKKGETLNSVIHRLQAKGLFDSVWHVKVFAKLNKLGSGIQAGEFKLHPPMNVPKLLAFLSSNNQLAYPIQFIEGSSFRDALAVLKAESKLKQSLKDASLQEIAEKLGIDKETHLEGQFYPDTYLFHKGDSDLDILKRSHERLKTILEEEWQARQKKLPLASPYDALILASIIEKETGVPEERAEIAGVFIRRLEKKMRLQTDPTVIYGLGERYRGNITRKHLREFTPYNTYRISGLPPSPIALVGREAIHAALHPKPGDSLYFVAKGDGSHYFSTTIEEHNSAVRQYQLKRRSDYRSSAK